MKKRIVLLIVCAFMILQSVCVFTSCDVTGEISFKTLTVNGTNVYGTVSSDTTEFSFINEIKVSGSAKYIVSLDVQGMQIAATKTVLLNPGENVFYVTVLVEDEVTKVYTVTIKRETVDITGGGSGGTEQGGSGGTEQGGGSGTVDALDDLPPSFEGTQKMYGGKKFTVLTHEDRAVNQAFNIVDLVPNEELGDEAVTVAVEQRNAKIKIYFGVSIVREKVPQGELYNTATRTCQQMNDHYSVFRLRVDQALKLALTGALLDLNEERWIDLSLPWWDDGITEDLLLYDGAYFGLGDICTVDDDATWVVLFNKFIYEDATKNDPTVLYGVVKQGDGTTGGWTVDAMKGIAQLATKEELDKSKNIYDSTYSGDGRYGLVTQWALADALMVSNGYNLIKYDANDPFKAREVGSNSLFAAVDKVFDFMGGTNSDNPWLLMAEKIDRSAYAVDMFGEVIRPMFKDDRSLFFICHVGTIGLSRDMESEFGILPMPKLDSGNLDYGNTVQYNCADCYVIPNVGNDKNAEFAAYILEALAYYSSTEYDEATGEKTSLTYAYYETVFKRKSVRDDDSVEMLELIFENRIFDIAFALDLKGVTNVVRSSIQGDSNTFMSSYAAISPNNNGLYNELGSMLERIIEIS